MTREEINDFLDVNSKEDIIDFIFNMESELLRTKKGLEAAQLLITNSISKDRYNDLVKKYNAIAKKRGK